MRGRKQRRSDAESRRAAHHDVIPHFKRLHPNGVVHFKQLSVRTNIAVFPILADPVDVTKGDQLCETVSQPSTQPDKVHPPMGS